MNCSRINISKLLFKFIAQSKEFFLRRNIFINYLHVLGEISVKCSQNWETYIVHVTKCFYFLPLVSQWSGILNPSISVANCVQRFKLMSFKKPQQHVPLITGQVWSPLHYQSNPPSYTANLDSEWEFLHGSCRMTLDRQEQRFTGERERRKQFNYKLSSLSSQQRISAHRRITNGFTVQALVKCSKLIRSMKEPRTFNFWMTFSWEEKLFMPWAGFEPHVPLITTTLSEQPCWLHS